MGLKWDRVFGESDCFVGVRWDRPSFFVFLGEMGWTGWTEVWLDVGVGRVGRAGAIRLTLCGMGFELEC